MKLHLPLNLYKALLLAAVAGTVTFTQDAYAGVMHEDISFQTYADFGQNKGRYVVGTQVNALLEHIRTNVDKGIKISYETDRNPFTISNEQGMIDFRGVFENGALAAISPTFTATCKHNGSNNASYGVRTVGAANAIKYQTIDIRGSNTFRLFPKNNWDYMLQRQSKVQTDATWNPIYFPDTNGDGKVTEQESQAAVSALHGGYVYHAGAGEHKLYTGSGIKGLTGPYQYIIGDINKIHTASTQQDGSNNITVAHGGYYGGDGYLDSNPLPNALIPGDSGSPSFVYNATTKRYEYIGAQNSGNFLNSANVRGNVVWTHDTLNSFNKQVDFSKGTIDGDSSTVYLNAIGENQAGEVKKDNLGNTGTIYTGKVTNGAGEELATYRGIRNGLNTWSDLSDIKNNEKWYAYTGHLVQSNTDLFFNDNLVFSSSAEDNKIILNADVDLGVGYVEFKEGEYTISAAGEYQLDSAGYVLNKNSEVHLNLTNDTNRMTEWRATGPGTLYLEGSKDNNVLLNVGGESTIYLQQKDGYAAYNVLVNTGATVVISDINQIERDFTFGSGGGTLDLNGNSHTWDNSDAVEDAGFTIHALTDEALITNSSTNKVTLTVTSPDSVYKGSFTGNMDVVYTGSGNWTLHSIHTKLADGCGFTVQSGKVIFSGVNTEHGMGSATGTNKNRLVNTRDWHYADAQMNVTVNGGTFELGSHARLTGDVTVKNGTFIMREGVQHDREYVEGGVSLEAVSDYKDYYGLKGKVSLSDGTSLQIHYNASVTAHNEYAYDITGSGNVSVNLGTAGAKLTLSGNNTFSGTKTLSSGTLIAGTHDALGDCETNKWKIEDAGVLSMTGVTQDSTQVWQCYVASDSTGVLALSENQTTQLALSEHQNLIIGALEGKTVTYGNSSETLTAHNGGWVLGGGGGTLVVDAKLTGEDRSLIIGNDYGVGTVKLNNTSNDFTGTITVNGRMTLDYAVSSDGSSALGKGVISQAYGNRTFGHGGSSNFSQESGGVLLIDKLVSGQKIDMSNHADLFIGTNSPSEISTEQISLTEGQAYQFGGCGGEGQLTVNGQLAAGRDLVVDSQGYVGKDDWTSGRVILTEAQTSFNGHVTVMGYDETKIGANEVWQGEIALELQKVNALANAESVTVKNGGQLWILMPQSFKKLTVDSSSNLYDPYGFAQLTVQSGSIDGGINLRTLNKIGSEAFSLAGAGGVSTVNVTEGSLNFAGDCVAETINIVTESSQSGSTATIGGDAYVVTVNLNNNGSLTVGGSASIASLQLNAGGALTLEGNKFTVDNLVINAGASYNVLSESRADGIGERVHLVTLAGGTLANKGTAVGDGKRQFYNVKLTADSTVDSSARFGIIGSEYATTKLDLGGKTLTKTGAGIFDIYNTSVTEGTVNVEEGQLHFNDKDKAHHSVIAADIALTGEGASFNIDKTGTGVVALAGDSTEVSSMNIKKGSVVLAGAQASVDSVSVNGGKLLLGSYTSAVDDRNVTTVTFNKGVVIEGKDGKEGTITGGITTTTADGGLTISLSGASSTDKAIVANTLIDIMEGCTLEMSNVVLQDTSRVTDATATFKVNDVGAQVSGNNIATRESTTMGTTTLTAFGAERTTIEVDAAAHVLNLTSSLMDTVSVTGSNFIIELDEDINLEGYSYVSLTFTDGYTPASFDAGMDITLVYGDSTYEVYYAGDDTTKLYAAIPEPTTASLSLLALAALAARRRRK